ncbi:hypothetical protein I6H46_06375 [Anaerococcus obesiensis]|uniref:TubC N-terminal docking domain-containing protein n=1 Tax=Anaerococcus obesiensis TaxID=1287640 RepID=A0A7T7USS7_9FIRM|nr:hypothetical protein [Anaerococcus obesiensis]QQN55538.1 hypothetical protein I6H46_06375 [Anaerococcus obesiensis]
MENGYKEIIEKYSKQGIELYVDGEKLKYKSINGQLDEDILMELKLNKEGLKEYIKNLRINMMLKMITHHFHYLQFRHHIFMEEMTYIHMEMYLVTFIKNFI